MAIFMTIGMLQILSGELTGWPSLVMLLTRQMVIGLLIGIAFGYIAVWSLKKVHLQVAGLYPILAATFGLMSFGVAADLGGSGFLATYLTGIVIGNYHTPFNRGILAFHDALAWLGQITMFILLGLLSFPSRLFEVVGAGLAVAFVLAFVARPLAVFLCLLRSQFNFREKVLLSWVGLKGAVPITLAIFPLMADLEGASRIFDIVFFVVLVSAVLQGSTLKWFAQKLKLDIKPKQEAPITLEISSLYEVDADIVDYFIEPDTIAAGKSIRQLALPYDVVIALIVRDHKSKLPKGSSVIEAGDHVIVVVHRAVRQAVDRVFARSTSQNLRDPLPARLEFPLSGTVRIGDLENSYTITIGGPPDLTLSEWIRKQLGDAQPSTGGVVSADSVQFSIRDFDSAGNINLVGMAFTGDVSDADLACDTVGHSMEPESPGIPVPSISDKSPNAKPE